MTDHPPSPRLLRSAFAASASGILVSLLLFLRPGPYTVMLFIMVAQPLLVAGFGLFLVQVYRDLRRRKVL